MSVILVFINLFMIATIVVMLAVILYALPKKQSPIIRSIGFLTVLTAIYMVGYLFEINAESLDYKLFWNYFQYISLPLLPAFWLVVALKFLSDKPIRLYVLFLILMVPAITYIARFTNYWHQLFYVNVYLENTLIGPMMAMDYGPLFYLQLIYIMVVFLGANIIYLRVIFRSSKKDILRLIRMPLASFAPWVGVLLNTLLPSRYAFDYASVFFPIAIVVFVYSLKDEHRLSIMPFARNQMFSNALEGIIVIDLNKSIIDYNRQATYIFNRLGGLKYQSINVLKKQYPALPLDMNPGESDHFVLDNATYQVTKSSVKNHTQKTIGFAYTFYDNTENMNIIAKLKVNEERIKFLIHHDALTKLYNRNYLEEYLKNIEISKRNVYLLMIDMNELKYVNDHHGHQQGDRLIISLATLITKHLSNEDCAIRLGGDEFLIFKYLDDEAELEAWIATLLKESKKIPHLSFSVGYALKTPADSFDYIYKVAEDNMYQHKANTKSAHAKK